MRRWKRTRELARRPFIWARQSMESARRCETTRNDFAFRSFVEIFCPLKSPGGAKSEPNETVTEQRQHMLAHGKRWASFSCHQYHQEPIDVFTPIDIFSLLLVCVLYCVFLPGNRIHIGEELFEVVCFVFFLSYRCYKCYLLRISSVLFLRMLRLGASFLRRTTWCVARNCFLCRIFFDLLETMHQHWTSLGVS